MLQTDLQNKPQRVVETSAQRPTTKNLGKFEFLEKEELTELTSTVSAGSDADIYQLSMALFASSLLGDHALYENSMARILQIFGTDDADTFANPDQIKQEFARFVGEQEKSTSYWTWLLGRILLAADNLDETTTADRAAQLLLNILQDPALPKDSYQAWSWGYLLTYYASASESKYYQYRETTEQLADDVVSHEANPANILWTRVLQLQAAAVAGDEPAYQHILQQICQDVQQPSLVQALQLIPSDDYRAWAMSLVRLAAKTMNDDSTYLALQMPWQQALLDSASIYDKSLAKLTYSLSIYPFSVAEPEPPAVSS